MNKSTINYLLLVTGIVLLIWGFYSFWLSDKNPTVNKASVFAIIAGVFIVSKRLTKTKELPSKDFKERLRNKE